MYHVGYQTFPRKMSSYLDSHTRVVWVSWKGSGKFTWPQQGPLQCLFSIQLPLPSWAHIWGTQPLGSLCTERPSTAPLQVPQSPVFQSRPKQEKSQGQSQVTSPPDPLRGRRPESPSVHSTWGGGRGEPSGRKHFVVLLPLERFHRSVHMGTNPGRPGGVRGADREDWSSVLKGTF